MVKLFIAGFKQDHIKVMYDMLCSGLLHKPLMVWIDRCMIDTFVIIRVEEWMVKVIADLSCKRLRDPGRSPVSVKIQSNGARNALYEVWPDELITNIICYAMGDLSCQKRMVEIEVARRLSLVS